MRSGCARTLTESPDMMLTSCSCSLSEMACRDIKQVWCGLFNAGLGPGPALDWLILIFSHTYVRGVLNYEEGMCKSPLCEHKTPQTEQISASCTEWLFLSTLILNQSRVLVRTHLFHTHYTSNYAPFCGNVNLFYIKLVTERLILFIDKTKDSWIWNMNLQLKPSIP